MDQLISLLEQSFTSNDNQYLNSLLDSFSTFCLDPNFYQSLNLILLNNSINPNIRFAALIYFKNVIQYRWEHLTESIHQKIIQVFVENIIHLHDPWIIHHIKQISDLLVDFNLIEVPWSNYIIQFLNNDPISSLILMRSLIFQYQKKDVSEILTSILDFIFLEFQKKNQNPIFLKISFNIIRHSFSVIEYNENHLIFLIQFMSDNFIEDNILQYISIFSKISISKPSLIYPIASPLISNVFKYINNPKIAIRFFSMLSTFSKDDTLWKIFEANFLNFFIPFFTVDEKQINDPVKFINDHYFDSFSSNSDPSSAAFRCLEVVSQYHYSIIDRILQLLKFEYENNSNNIYSISHITSAVLKNYNFSEAKDLFNFVFQFLRSDSILTRCSSLIILQFECYLECPIEHHIQNCIELLFDQNLLIQYFSMNVLSKSLPYIRNIQILHNFPANSIISKILTISQKFEIPQFTDLLQYLFKDQVYLNQIHPFLLEIVNSTFSLAQFYSEISPEWISISSVFNSILTLIIQLKDAPPSIEFEICKLSFIRCIQILNSYLVTPVLEVILTSIYYSPSIFDEMWNSFDVFLPLLDEMSPVSRELVFSIFAIISLHDAEGVGNRYDMLSNIAAAIINSYEVNEFSIFIAALIHLNAIQNEVLPTLVCKIFLAWENDGIDFFNEFYELLSSLFLTCGNLFIEIFNERFSDFLDDVISSGEVKYLMLILPLIYQFLDDGQKLNCISIIESNDNESSFDEPNVDFDSNLPLPTISIFSDHEIIERYRKFKDMLK